MGQVHQKIIKMVFAVLLAPNPLFWEGTNKKKKKRWKTTLQTCSHGSSFWARVCGILYIVNAQILRHRYFPAAKSTAGLWSSFYSLAKGTISTLKIIMKLEQRTLAPLNQKNVWISPQAPFMQENYKAPMRIISLIHLRIHWVYLYPKDITGEVCWLSGFRSHFSGNSATKYNDHYRGHKKHFCKVLPSADIVLRQCLGQVLGTDLSISSKGPLLLWLFL